MSEESERVSLHITQHDARELYDLTTDALSDDPDNLALSRCSGALLAVIGDEWVEERDND